MDNEKTGGPAYPGHGSTGMTLLDHFAGLAMQSVVANGGSLGSSEGVARSAYGYAAAMIAERNRIMNER